MSEVFGEDTWQKASSMLVATSFSANGEKVHGHTIPHHDAIDLITIIWDRRIVHQPEIV